jgi:predicted metal-binding membrane protein
MEGTRLEAVLRRDRAVLLAALAALAILAWIYIIWIGAAMHGSGESAGSPHGSMMEHRSSADPSGLAPGLAPWSTADALIMLLMWLTMMIGMMTPSAAPMILIYARVGRRALDGGTPFAPAGWFASGYLLAWSGYAAAATALQWLLEAAMLLTPMMAAGSPLFGGLLLIAAGLYQWTPFKDNCLAQCQSPFLFIQRHGGFRADRAGALALGLRHGAYCIGCCWALMLLLFVGGVMNLLWIAAIAALVLAEKALPSGRMIARAVGLVSAGAGAALAAGVL